MVCELTAGGVLQFVPMPFAPEWRGLLALHAHPHLPRALQDPEQLDLVGPALAQLGLSDPGDLPLGAIVGVAELVECPWAGRVELPPLEEQLFGSWEHGCFWHLARPRRLRPIECAAGVHLWIPPAAVSAELNAQLLGGGSDDLR